jgi:hypothetical protein
VAQDFAGKLFTQQTRRSPGQPASLPAGDAVAVDSGGKAMHSLAKAMSGLSAGRAGHRLETRCGQSPGSKASATEFMQ